MTVKLKGLFFKHRAIIVYVLFGALTTLVDNTAFWLADFCGFPTMLSYSLAWILAVAFAYVTNRKWVFESRASGADAVRKELISFVAARLSTLFLGMGIVYLFVDILKYDSTVMKLIIKNISTVIVVIANYILSKLIVFKK